MGRSLRLIGAILAVGWLMSSCVSVPKDDVQPDEKNTGPVAMTQDEIIAVGLAEALQKYHRGEEIRLYAKVYSPLTGLRPVKLNNRDRQVSDKDSSLLIDSIRAIRGGDSLQAFAIYGLAVDREGKRWFVVHYESRKGKAQLRQYPVPPPTDVSSWHPTLVEATPPVIFGQ